MSKDPGAVRLGRKGGQATTPAKTAASRTNQLKAIAARRQYAAQARAKRPRPA